MKTTHTPGPWRVTHTGAHVGVECELGSICYYIGNGAEDNSNARLIASAPALLAALETAWMALGGVVHRNECIQHAMEKCQEAIEQARGEKLP